MFLYVGAKFYNVMFDKVYLNKFKVEISSLSRRSPSDATSNIKTREKLSCSNVDLKQHEHKIPHQNIISNFHTLVPNTKTSLYFV